jgi:hypothetical protein
MNARIPNCRILHPLELVWWCAGGTVAGGAQGGRSYLQGGR